MMEQQRKSVLEKIEVLVQTIYSPDQLDLTKKFVDFLEALEDYIKVMPENAESICNILKQVELAYEIKDYIALSDFVSYELKPQII